MRRGIELAWEWILDIIFPKYCLGCKNEGEYVCGVCRLKLQAVYAHGCFGCRRVTAGGKVCEECQPRYAFDGLLIAADYEAELIGDLIKSCKYHFVKDLTGEIADLIIQKLETRLRQDFKEKDLLDTQFFSAVVMSVPLSRRRLRWRGFNQAELIAKRVGEYFSLPVVFDLKRIKHRKAQAKLNEAERLGNLKDCFAFSGSAPKLVVLIDDVATTGATLNECARVLKEAGVEEVWGAVAAKG